MGGNVGHAYHMDHNSGSYGQSDDYSTDSNHTETYTPYNPSGDDSDTESDTDSGTDSELIQSVPQSVHSVLTEYGKRIPKAIGKAARSSGLHGEHPETVVVLRKIEDSEITDALRVYFVSDYDGNIAFLCRYNGSDDPNVYYTLPEGVLQGCLHRLCSDTSLVIERCDEEYDPYSDDE